MKMISTQWFLGWILLTLVFAGVCRASTQWQELAPGLQYSELEANHGMHFGKLHAFKVNLQRYQLKIAFAKDMQRVFANVRSMTLLKHGLVGINGGFFTPQMQPLGLRISEGKLRHRLKRTPWWGVLLIKKGRPSVVSLKQYTPSRDVDFAIQSGPRLVVNGKIPMLKDGVANRSALGITRDQDLIIVATEHLEITTTELAAIMRASSKNNGLDCVDALNLDGGSSTQLYADVDGFKLSVPSFAPVSDAVVVTDE